MVTINEIMVTGYVPQYLPRKSIRIDTTIDGIDVWDMNIHHLELFYHVARHGGISQAVRKMPYGIQQPAMSSQVAQLEEALAARLFQRRPFKLTPAGRELYQFITPFFGNLEQMAGRIRGETASHLRLSAPGTALRDHFPELLARHRRRFPGLKVTLHQACHEEAERMLLDQEIDLAITILEKPVQRGLCSRMLLELPLVLLLPNGCQWRHVRDAFSQQPPETPLVALPRSEPVMKLFSEGLRKIRRDWPTQIEVTSIDLLEAYVEAGFGVGITAQTAGVRRPHKLKTLALPGFPSLKVAALWQEKIPPIASEFLMAVSERVKQLRAV
jgi:DNA-binding transcriptional LysR family regulator